jgi:hypothetical protein
MKTLMALALTIVIALSNTAMAEEITIGGFAFAGDFKSAAERFPLTFSLYQKATKEKTTTFSREVIERMRTAKNERIDFNLGEKQVNLKQSDRALMAVLMLTGETTSTENFGSYFKTFVSLRGDALIFDYKNQVVVRSYPLSVVLFDATETAPTKERLAGFVDDLVRRQDGRGLVTQFLRRMEAADVTQKTIKTVQVRKSSIDDVALALMPQGLRNDKAAIESIAADGFASILSAKTGVSLLPRSIGHAVGGVMSMRLENGDDYKLKIGEGDYVFDLSIKKLAKIKAAESNVSTTYVYGAYVDIDFLEPALGTAYLSTSLKNGETSVIPAGQISNDDFPAYQDALRGLFLKLSDALNGSGDGKWLKTAASGKDIEPQITSSRKIIGECK